MKQVKSVSNPDKAYRTLFRVAWTNLKIRFYLEPRDAWIGLFWDVRGLDLSLWICFLPFFPVQIVFPIFLEEQACPCGFRHGTDRPEWCKKLLTLEAENKTFRRYIEDPIFQAHINFIAEKRNQEHKN